jgi:lysophospholipase-2
MAANDNIHIIEPTKKHTHTFILLHGRDSNAAEFATDFFESQASDDRTLPQIFPNYKWVLPTSALRHSARFETEMSQWFDMWSVEDPEEQKELQVQGLKESIAFIMDVIHQEAKFVHMERIILGGISQGCATVICALMASGVPMGGFVGLCSWLPFSKEVNDIATGPAAAKKSAIDQLQILFGNTTDGSDSERVSLVSRLDSALKTPIFLSHSKDDEVVPIGNGQKLCRGLRSLGASVSWREYEDGGHWVNEPEGVSDIVAFLLEKCC